MIFDHIHYLIPVMDDGEEEEEEDDDDQEEKDWKVLTDSFYFGGFNTIIILLDKACAFTDI